jgi:RNA ligase
MESGLMIKIKQDDYVYLHRLITGMNARVVWEKIGEGLTADGICEGLPEEFWPWVREVGGGLIREKSQIIDAATAEHEALARSLPEGWTRKDYALEAAKSPLRPWLFLLLDGRDPSAKIWRTLRPSGEHKLVAYSEDTA